MKNDFFEIMLNPVLGFGKGNLTPRDIPRLYYDRCHFGTDRIKLWNGPYHSPPFRVGQRVRCVLNGPDVRVCRWSDGRIPWPLGRVGHGGKGAYIVTPKLAKAIQAESMVAMCHWFGISTATVNKWRRALGVASFNVVVHTLLRICGFVR